MNNLDLKICIRASLSGLVLLMLMKIIYNLVFNLFLRRVFEGPVLYMIVIVAITSIYLLAGIACGNKVRTKVKHPEINSIVAGFLLWLEYMGIGLILIAIYLRFFYFQPEDSPWRAMVYPILDFQHNFMINSLFVLIIIVGSYLGVKSGE